ncbi:MAG: hypothetical protein MUF53_03615 [Gemmatimonadaceae bacterium]|jgi:hypothetical protein|nr:hypothetical protein [Gemmatimonadaceae bacterium]
MPPLRCSARAAVVILLAAPLSLSAQGAGRPAPRPIGPVVATSVGALGAVSAVRPLPGGRVLVNDIVGRQVLLFDSTLASPQVVADTTPATGSAYAGRFAGLVPYRGDSTLFVDPQSLSMLVIDPAGKLGRTMSVPNTQEAAFIAGAQTPSGFDPQGRIIYRGMNMPRFGPRGPGAPTPGQPFQIPPMPDTAPVQRIALATRTVDTVAFFKVPRPSMQVTQTEGRVTMTSKVNPIPLVDDWAALPNGDVAIVRGQDYHVDIYRTDGTVTRGPKIPFTWRRLTDDEKVAFLDSVKAARARMPAPTPGQGAPSVMAFSGPGGGGAMPAPPPGGGGMQVIMMGGGPGGPGGGPPEMVRGGAAPQLGAPQVVFVEPSELPDYLPPFAANSTRVDPQGRLWIRLALPTPAGTGPLYDVIDGSGQLVDHVQLPAGRLLAGFAVDGSVLLQSRTEQGTVRLERALLRTAP